MSVSVNPRSFNFLNVQLQCSIQFLHLRAAESPCASLQELFLCCLFEIKGLIRRSDIMTYCVLLSAIWLAVARWTWTVWLRCTTVWTSNILYWLPLASPAGSNMLVNRFKKMDIENALPGFRDWSDWQHSHVFLWQQKIDDQTLQNAVKHKRCSMMFRFSCCFFDLEHFYGQQQQQCFCSSSRYNRWWVEPQRHRATSSFGETEVILQEKTWAIISAAVNWPQLLQEFAVKAMWWQVQEGLPQAFHWLRNVFTVHGVS